MFHFKENSGLRNKKEMKLKKIQNEKKEIVDNFFHSVATTASAVAVRNAFSSFLLFCVVLCTCL